MDRVLFLDIETTPNEGSFWGGKYEQNILKIKKYWELLSVGYKWLGEKKIHCVSRRKFKKEKDLVLFTWDLFDKAEIIIAHNGDDFDIKKVRAKFGLYRLTPPSPSRSIDTKKIAKKYLNLPSYSLNDICDYLGIGKKKETGGYSLWEDCMLGKESAFLKMEKYNRQDVVLLEKVYLELRRWIQNQPALSVSTDKRNCPNCDSNKVIKRGFGYLRSGKKQRWQCEECGSWFSS